MRFIEFIIILQHVFEKIWSIQLIGAFGSTGTAADAVFDLMHLIIPFICHILLPGGTAKKHVHPGAVAYFNSYGTGHAVAAAAAEAAGEFAALLPDEGE